MTIRKTVFLALAAMRPAARYYNFYYFAGHALSPVLNALDNQEKI